MFIYLIRNKINNKVYIGKTESTVEKRWKKHLEAVRNKVNRYLYDAINHYGVDNFSIEIIEQCRDREELNDKEKYWIKFHKSMDKNYGYNMQEGGFGGRQLPEIIERVKLKKKGFRHSLETKVKMSQVKKGKFNHFQSEETKKKLSLVIKKLWADGKITSKNNAMRGKKGELHPFYGGHHTKEAKLKIANSRLGKSTSQKQKDIASQNWLSIKNPNYKDINAKKLKEMLLDRKNNIEIANYFKTSVQTIISKTKLYFNVLPSYLRKNRCLCVCHDNLSKMIWAHPIKNCCKNINGKYEEN